MFILSNFLVAVARILDIGLNIYYWVILIRVLLSWVNPDPYNPIVQILMRLTEPVLERVRRFMPRMAIDLSPIIVFFGIIFLQTFLVQSLYQIAARLNGVG